MEENLEKEDNLILDIITNSRYNMHQNPIIDKEDAMIIHMKQLQREIDMYDLDESKDARYKSTDIILEKIYKLQNIVNELKYELDPEKVENEIRRQREQQEEDARSWRDYNKSL